MALTLRTTKGDLLTHQELDGNFTHLEGKINAEESARIDADTDLDSRVSTVSTALGNRVTKVSSTDNAIVRFDGTSGEVQDSGVTIDDSGLINGSISGNSATATKLQNARTINGVLFDGTADIEIEVGGGGANLEGTINANEKEQMLSRSNHTGVQSMDTISGLAESLLGKADINTVYAEPMKY